MADTKISQLTAYSTPAAEDLLPVVDDPNGTPVNKKITLKNLFGNIPANTSITGNLTVSANVTFSGANVVSSANVNFTGALNSINALHVTSTRFTVSTALTPGSNNATTEFGSPLSNRAHDGSIFWDENYLYVATSNTVIKRVALSVF